MIRGVGIADPRASRSSRLPLPQGTWAQPSETGAPLNDTQKLGQRLFYQSCVVCHTQAANHERTYGPVLSKDSLSGQEDVMREFISNGTSRIAGLQVSVRADPDQCDRRVPENRASPESTRASGAIERIGTRRGGRP